MTPWGKVSKFARMRIGLPYVRRADRARDEGRWIDAILDFRRSLEWLPWRDDLRVQIGNCLKEFGDYEAAADYYTAVTRIPALYDAQKQLDDLDRHAGRPVLRYRVTAAPPRGDGRAQGSYVSADLTARLFPNRIRRAEAYSRHWLGSLGDLDTKPIRWRGTRYVEIKFDQIAALSLSHAGIREPIFTGIVAVRGRIASLRHLDQVGFSLTAGASRIDFEPARLEDVDGRGPIKLHVFNAWLDCAGLPPGRHWFEASVQGIAPSGTFVHVVPQTDLSAEFATSNSYVPSMAGASADEAVLRLPAVARPASRVFFDRPICAMLVMRADQLGDVSVSLPAFARLRSLFPEARITALVQPAVAAIVGASGVADEVLTLKLDYDARTERRHLSLDEEARLRKLLVDRALDLAIDLCPGDETRPLLLLSGATYLVGFGPERFGFLDFGIAARSRDKVNQLEKISHTATVLALVEALAVAATPDRPPVPRTAPIRDATFTDQGLEPNGYAVLHTGARHPLNEWPLEKYAILAAAIARDTDLRVIIFLNPGAVLPPIPTDVANRIVQAGFLDPDMFDEIIANAAVVVGNDSGPKHLAAVRGVPTVSIQVGRLNWDEWGQDARGFIVAKRVPCTGCGLNDIALCGREAICVRSVSTAEVLDAVLACLAGVRAVRPIDWPGGSPEPLRGERHRGVAGSDIVT